MRNLKEKVKTYILSHFLKNTYKHYLILLGKNEESISLLNLKDAEIARIKELVEIYQVRINKIIRNMSSTEEQNIELQKKVVQFESKINSIHEKNKEKIALFQTEIDTINAQKNELSELNRTSQEALIQHKQAFEAQFRRQKETIAFLLNYTVKQETLDFSGINNFTYDNLHSILDNSESIEAEAFKIIASNIHSNNLANLKNKSKIKIGFLVPQASIWSCDSIYKKFASDSRFNTFIIVIPFEYGTDQKIINETYTNTCNFFEYKKYQYIKAYNVTNHTYLSFEETGSPDFLFHLTPHTTYIHNHFKLESLPLNVLNIYIPYGIMIVDGYQVQFNQKSHHLFWKIFCETPIHKEMAKNHSLVGDFNIECSGYVKMDAFLDGSHAAEASTIWKFHELNKNTNGAIKIIWAPHHALVDHPHAFGTFHKNYMFFYEYAKDTPEISWIVKPHPLLKNDSIHFGLFKDSDEYDEYMNMWDRLPNAKTVHEGSYIDIFKTSDAIILDSVSFLAEYLFVQKPSLFLTKSCDTFNEFGDIIKDCHYQAEGDDFEGIRNFIEEIVIRKNDSKANMRKVVFEKYLNYLNFNGGILASDYVYKYLTEPIE